MIPTYNNNQCVETELSRNQNTREKKIRKRKKTRKEKKEKQWKKR